MDIYEEVIQKFNEEINLLRISIAQGQADNFANYKHLVGRVQGIEWSKEVITTIMKKIYEGEEE
jgi:hypothetical protein